MRTTTSLVKTPPDNPKKPHKELGHIPHAHHPHTAPQPVNDVLEPYLRPPKFVKNGAHNSAGHQNLPLSNTIEDHYVEEADRLKGEIRGRDLEILALKQELQALRQVERRKQREIDELVTQDEEGPKLIKSLKDELHGLRGKWRELVNQKTTDERLLRLYSDKIAKLEEKNESFRVLLEEKELEARDTLQRQLDSEQKRLAELKQHVEDIQKKAELTEKNVTSENIQLRHKIHKLEEKLATMTESYQKMQTLLQEKEKTIASLSIYRYRLMHGQADSECKACKRREKEELESQKRFDILSKIPVLDIANVEPLSTTTALFYIRLLHPSLTCVYDRFRIIYSTDSQFERNVTEKTVFLRDLLKSAQSRRNTSLNLSGTSTPNSAIKKIELQGFDPGATYYFYTVALNDRIEGNASHIQAAIIDVVPQQPSIPTLRAVTRGGPRIVVNLNIPPQTIGTPIKAIRIYHATSPEIIVAGSANASPETSSVSVKVATTTNIGLPELPTFLVAEIEPDSNLFDLEDPDTTVYHYFQVSCVNNAGESQKSAISLPCWMDIVPPAPPAPRVWKQDARSVIVSTVLPQLNKKTGSLPDGMQIWCKKITLKRLKNSDEDGSDTKETNAEPDISLSLELNSATKLIHSIDNLECGFKYSFATKLRNKEGWSDQSEWSEPIRLEDNLPTPSAPGYELVNATTVDILLPTIVASSEEEVSLILSSIYGYKLLMSRNVDMSDAIVVNSDIPLNKEHVTVKLSSFTSLDAVDDGYQPESQPISYRVSDLEFGGNYYFAIVFKGRHNDESTLSPSTWVPLAASLVLPPSTTSLTNLSNEQSSQENKDNSVTGDTTEPNPRPLIQPRVVKRPTIRLTLDQKVLNMHRGKPSQRPPTGARNDDGEKDGSSGSLIKFYVADSPPNSKYPSNSSLDQETEPNSLHASKNVMSNSKLNGRRNVSLARQRLQQRKPASAKSRIDLADQLHSLSKSKTNLTQSKSSSNLRK